MFIQSDINKWRLSQLEKLDKLYINSESTRFLQRSRHNSIEYKNQTFTNHSHIHLRAFYSVSLFRFPYIITGSNI